MNQKIGNHNQTIEIRKSTFKYKIHTKIQSKPYTTKLKHYRCLVYHEIRIKLEKIERENFNSQNDGESSIFFPKSQVLLPMFKNPYQSYSLVLKCGQSPTKCRPPSKLGHFFLYTPKRSPPECQTRLDLRTSPTTSRRGVLEPLCCRTSFGSPLLRENVATSQRRDVGEG